MNAKGSVWIKTDGTRQVVKPKNGKDFKLEELQGFVGGLIELVYLNNKRVMVVNEEGLVYDLPFNELASDCCQVAGVDTLIFGDVLVCDSKLIK